MTESNIEEHVIKNAKYMEQLKSPYVVVYNGKMYQSKTTRGLVEKICKARGIPYGQ
jgi:hypothetical protein